MANITRTFNLELPAGLPGVGEYVTRHGQYGRVEGYELELRATKDVAEHFRLVVGDNMRAYIVMRLRVPLKNRGRLHWASACQVVHSFEWGQWRPVQEGDAGLAEVLRRIDESNAADTAQRRYGVSHVASLDMSPDKGR